MTAMNLMIESDSIMLSMDTLVSIKENGKTMPNYFTQKFDVLPFTKSIIAGTGQLSIVSKAIDISREVLSQEVETFAHIVADEIKKAGPALVQKNYTSTLYIFGFDDSGKTHAYAMRSIHDFELEEILKAGTGGCIFKPANKAQVEVLGEIIENTDDPTEGLIKIMRKEKEWDDMTEDGVGIGGENILLVVTEEFNISIIEKIDVFSDYDSQYACALKNIHKQLDL